MTAAGADLLHGATAGSQGGWAASTQSACTSAAAQTSSSSQSRSRPRWRVVVEQERSARPSGAQPRSSARSQGVAGAATHQGAPPSPVAQTSSPSSHVEPRTKPPRG